MPQREPEYLLGITTGIKMVSQNLAELHRIEHQRAVISGLLMVFADLSFNKSTN